METAPIAGPGLETAPIAAGAAWVEPVIDGGVESVEKKVRRWGDQMWEACDEAEKDQDFFDSWGQWSDAERSVLDIRGQPIITANRIKPAINGIVGVIENGRTDPKAWPRTPQDEGSAELATDVLRFLADTNRFQSLKSTSLTEELIWGWTATLTQVEDGETRVVRIRPEEFIWDPASRERDLSDATYMGVGRWRYLDEVAEDFPTIPAEELENSLAGPSTSIGNGPASTEDRPFWADTANRRVFVVELYYRLKGEWLRCIFVRGLVLEAGPSAYIDPKTTRTRCPIEAVRAYVDRRNRPYGLVRDMRDPQRELNMRRSKILHEITHRQWLFEDGAIEDEEAFRVQAARADGMMKVGAGALTSGRVQKIDKQDVVQYQVALLQESKAEIERQGANPGVLGRDVKGQSGRAILAQQQAGLMELATVLGWFDDYILRVYRQMWLCAQQFGTPEDFIRITDPSGKAQFVETWEMRPVIDPATGQQRFDPVLDPATGAPAIDPSTGGPVLQPVEERVNRLALLDVDIVLDTAPDVAVIEEEQFQTVAELLPIIAGIPSPQVQAALPELIKRLLLSSNLRNKQEMAETLNQSDQPDPAAQAAQQLQMAAAQADVEKTQSETAKNMAGTDKLRAETAATVVGTADTMRQADLQEQGRDDASQDREQRERQFQPKRD